MAVFINLKIIDIFKVAFLISAIPVIIQTLLLPDVKNKSDLVRFFLFSILITVFLIFIIEIKLHHILRAWINIPNTFIYFIYASLIIYYLIKYKPIILSYNSLLMLSSFAFFGIAVVLDLISGVRFIHFTQSDIVKDIFQLSETIFWLLFFISVYIKVKIKGHLKRMNI